MITPALVILLVIIGWGAATVAMLWGMLRIARYHHKPSPDVTQDRRTSAVMPTSGMNVSLSA